MKFFFRPHFKHTLLGALAATLLVGGLSACSHRSHEFGTGMSAEQYAEKRDKMINRAASKLDLNAEQKQRLSVLGDKLLEQRTALVGSGKDPRAEIKALLAGDKLDAARVQALLAEKIAALNSKSPEVTAALADFYNSLNTTQQQKVRDHLEGRGRWFGWS